MSFLTVENEMVRDLWPHLSGRPVDDDTTVEDLADWQLIPITFDGVCESIDILGAGKDSTGAARHRLVYKKRSAVGEEEDRVYEVCLRLQGVVHSSSIGPLGDWNGTPASCARATHKMQIDGSMDEGVFMFQHTAIDNIKTCIYRTLKSRPQRSSKALKSSDVIYLERRVFTKVRPTDPISANALVRGDDPDGLAKKVEKQWVVDHRIGYSMQLEDGSRKSCSYVAIRSGDFVDIGITFDILTRFSRGRRNTSITLAVKDVMRLQTASEVEVVKYYAHAADKQVDPIVATSSGLQVEECG